MEKANAAVRAQLAEMLAGYLHAHLTAELAKPPAVIERVISDGRSFVDATRSLLADLIFEFPECGLGTHFNLFEAWVIRRELPVKYAENTFLLYGRTFLTRIIDLRDATMESRARLRDKIRHILRSGKFRGQNFTFRIFFHAESVMLDLIRERILAHSEIEFESAWETVKDQSEFWAECGYDYYDDLLRAALQRLQLQKDEAEARANRVEQEIKMARDIQMSILPAHLPDLARGSVAALYQPAAMVGGDYYDFIPISPSELGIMIADVTGHGVPAALIASMIKVSFAHQQELVRAPARMLHQMDKELSMPSGHLISAAYVYIDTASGQGVLASAGHPPIVLRGRKNNTIREISSSGTLMGWRPDHPVPAETVFELEPGDRLLLYTDGLMEAANVDGEMFGFERLAETLAKLDHLSPDDALASLVDRVVDFKGRGRAFLDDVTVVLIDFLVE